MSSIEKLKDLSFFGGPGLDHSNTIKNMKNKTFSGLIGLMNQRYGVSKRWLVPLFYRIPVSHLSG